MNKILSAKVLAFALVLSLAPQANANLVLTMGGDVNFNKHNSDPHATLAPTNAGPKTFEWMTRGIRHLINGDMNFANIETVVTDQRLAPNPKAFNFASHPNSMRHLMSVGFNLFSLANNHSYDFGIPGKQETDRHFDLLSREFRNIIYSGGGMNRQLAARPRVFDVKGYRVAFLAISILDERFRAGPQQEGYLNYLRDEDYKLALSELRKVDAQLKILSIHFGTEKFITLNPGQKRRFEEAIRIGGADIVIGHHPHVVRPVQILDGKLIFYSLGNYLMPGAASIDERTPGFDWGLFARVHYGLGSDGRLWAQAVEAVPLRRMHIQPTQVDPMNGTYRLSILNTLSVDQVGATALRFRKRADGTGYACSVAGGIQWTESASRVCGSAVSANDFKQSDDLDVTTLRKLINQAQAPKPVTHVGQPLSIAREAFPEARNIREMPRTSYWGNPLNWIQKSY